VHGDAELSRKLRGQRHRRAGLQVFQVGAGLLREVLLGGEVRAEGQFWQADELGTLGGGDPHAFPESVLVVLGVWVPGHLDQAGTQRFFWSGRLVRAALPGRGAERGAEAGEQSVGH
jgi:hypothetical protein